MLSTTLTNRSTAFADARLQRRFMILRRQLGQSYRQSIPQATASKGQMKAAYRFLRNDRVRPRALIEAQFDSIDEALAQSQAAFLCISDTTELDYTGKRSGPNLGPLTYRLRRGMFAHTTLLVSEAGLPQGLINQRFIVRRADYFGQADQRRYWPIERKESYRWLLDFERMQCLSRCHGVPLIFVADREADMMEIFHARSYEQAHFVIRSQFNRCTTQIEGKLYDVLADQPFVYNYSINLPHPKTRKLRRATLQLRFAPVQVALGHKTQQLKAKKHLSPVDLFAVEVKELNAPADIDQPIEWILLTSLAVHQVKDARRVISIYCKRWIIERFHYLLKSGGAAVENLQIETAAALQNAITTYSIVVMDAMKIKYAAEQQPDLPIRKLGVSPQVCHILYRYVAMYGATDIVFDPQNPPTAWEFCRVLGRLGGFIPSKRRPLPGLKILTRALEQLDVIIKTLELVQNNDTPP